MIRNEAGGGDQHNFAGHWWTSLPAQGINTACSMQHLRSLFIAIIAIVNFVSFEHFSLSIMFVHVRSFCTHGEIQAETMHFMECRLAQRH